MVSIDRQKEIGLEILSTLQQEFPTILAGGAPRDWYFGKEAQDLDFFVLGFPSQEEIEDALGEAIEPSVEKEYEDMGFRTFNFERDGQAIQVMACKDDSLVGVVSRFPVSLCQISFDGEFHASDDFCLTEESGVLSVEATGDGALLSKVLRKFPGLVSHWVYSKEEFFQCVGKCSNVGFVNFGPPELDLRRPVFNVAELFNE